MAISNDKSMLQKIGKVDYLKHQDYQNVNSFKHNHQAALQYSNYHYFFIGSLKKKKLNN